MEQEKKDSAVKPKLTPSLQIFEEALKTWWPNLKKFAMMYVWGMLYALIPVVVCLAFFGLNLITGLRTNIFFSLLSFIVFIVALAFIIYFLSRSYIGILLLIKNDYVGQEKEIFKDTKKWFWPYIGLSLLTALFLFLWFCLLIIPSIIFSVFYCFATYVLFFENKRGRAAIKRSVQLVKSYWWAVFGRFCQVGLVVCLLLYVVSFPFMFMDEGTLMFSIWNAITQVISMLIAPFTMLFSYRIYKDLVKIKK